jgi:ubiquinone/menaquinone biosynthesis C-methylase UbiE
MMKTCDSEKFVEEKMKILGRENTVLDVGGSSRFQKWLAKYKYLFDGAQYKTMDMDASTNPDIVGDIHHMPVSDASVDAIICSSVLEHIDNPILAVQEMHRVLKKGGKLFIYVPSIYPYHARQGHYPDMWRFFEDSLLFLCKDFSSVEICKYGGYFKALSFFVPMQNKFQWMLGPLSKFLDSLFNTEKRHTTAGYYVYAIK